MHGRVRAVAGNVFTQRCGEILRILIAQARDAVGRPRILIVRNTMAAMAGVRQHLAFLSIALKLAVSERAGAGGSRKDTKAERQQGRSKLHSSLRLKAAT